MSTHVVIVQETMPQYRVALFAHVQRLAAERGIDVDVVHGHAPGARGRRLSTGSLPGAVLVRNCHLRSPGRNKVLVWQPVLRRCLKADLVVVEQANRLLVNYLLLLAQLLGGPKLAFWGHGRDHQSAGLSFGERFKARMAVTPWWWFAYTTSVTNHLVSLGVPQCRITTVDNTIDVMGLRQAVDQQRAKGGDPSPFRCVFLGGLYSHKRLRLLFEAADMIAQRLPGFELHIAGTGEESDDVERFAQARPWAHYWGAVEGGARAELLASARLLLVPGLVGLVLLDSFAAGVPLVSTGDALHSPEIEYLQDGVNGVIVPAGSGAKGYADTVVRLLQDGAMWSRLSTGAHRSADRHMLEAAAGRFVDGLVASLARTESMPKPNGGILRRLRRKLLQQGVGRLVVRRADDSLVRLGSGYGGWWVPAAVLKRGTTVISAGVGEDTTFDEEILARGCEVWAVDPTPRAQQHVQNRSCERGTLGDGFHFWPVGLWHREEILRFYAPSDPSHVSHSVLNVQNANTWFEADCWSLTRLLKEAGLDSIDVLKLDIEGAELEVLRALIKGAVRPTVLCVELDAPLPEKRTLALLRGLRRAGYRLAHMEGWNLLLLYEPSDTGVCLRTNQGSIVWERARRRILFSRAAPLAAFPTRAGLAGGHLLHEARQTARWLIRSREHTNFTYDLQPLCLEYLCWFVSEIVHLPVSQVRRFVAELQDNALLTEHIRTKTRSAKRKWLADETVRYGRRLGWYALVRAIKPQLVVETGTDKGLGSCVIAAALLRNGTGRLVTIDINPESGYLIGPPYDSVVERRIGDSLAVLASLKEKADLFLHDSLHTKDHELSEPSTVKLTNRAYAISDNAHGSDALAVWAERSGRRFAFFDERPSNHWHPGAGLGVAWCVDPSV